MQYSTVLAVSFSLLQLSAAQSIRRRVHRRHIHQKGLVHDSEIITLTDSTVTESTEGPEVVVFVDQFGSPLDTLTETVILIPSSRSFSAAVPTSTKISATPTIETPAGPISNPTPPSEAPGDFTESPTTLTSPPEPTPATAPILTVTQTTSSVSIAVPPAQNIKLHGITYSPFKAGGDCKSAAEVDADFALFAENYGIIRLYGVDCNQVATVHAAAQKYGNKIMLGIFDIHQVQQAVTAMAEGVNGDWSLVDTVSVGNELINNGAATIDEIVDALSQARDALHAAGYNGPVVIVDTFAAAIDHPVLCDLSDYCAVNAHPFFDPNTSPEQAGNFLSTTVDRIRSKLADPTKRIVVTETGWPWKGSPNGLAVPGLDTQVIALASIQDAFLDNPADCIFFTAFNDLWKQPTANTFYAEQFWGISGRTSPADSS